MVREYIKSKANAWAPTTLRAEEARLRAMEPALTGDPQVLWDFLELHHKAYSRTTYWTRAVQYWDWRIASGLSSGPNLYSAWRKENARLFKGTYERAVPTLSYTEARERILSIPQTSIRDYALYLLAGGLRYTESCTLEGGQVLGKGSKRRKIFFKEDSVQPSPVPYMKLYRALKDIGLKPHDLRKIYANELAARGASPFQLCKAMGWANLNTAQSYIEATDNSIQELLK